jgi:hypothetical protein
LKLSTGGSSRELAQAAGGPVRRHRQPTTAWRLWLTRPNTGPHSWPAGPLLGPARPTPGELGQAQPSHDRDSPGADELQGDQSGEEGLIEVGERGRTSGGDQGPSSSPLQSTPRLFLLSHNAGWGRPTMPDRQFFCPSAKTGTSPTPCESNRTTCALGKATVHINRQNGSADNS